VRSSRTPVWKPTNSFLPSGVAPISHEHAFSGRFHSGLQIDPVRPTRIRYRRAERSRVLPGIVIRLPFRGPAARITAGDKFRRGPLPKRGGRAPPGSRRSTPRAGREPGNRRVETLRPPRPTSGEIDEVEADLLLRALPRPRSRNLGRDEPRQARRRSWIARMAAHGRDARPRSRPSGNFCVLPQARRRRQLRRPSAWGQNSAGRLHVQVSVRGSSIASG